MREENQFEGYLDTANDAVKIVDYMVEMKGKIGEEQIERMKGLSAEYFKGKGRARERIGECINELDIVEKLESVARACDKYAEIASLRNIDELYRTTVEQNNKGVKKEIEDLKILCDAIGDGIVSKRVKEVIEFQKNVKQEVNAKKEVIAKHEEMKMKARTASSVVLRDIRSVLGELKNRM